MSMQGQPDSAGWWAWEGYVSYANNPDRRLRREVVRVYWGNSTQRFFARQESGVRPVSMLIGKWWKLTMPWEDAQ